MSEQIAAGPGPALAAAPVRRESVPMERVLEADGERGRMQTSRVVVPKVRQCGNWQQYQRHGRDGPVTVAKSATGRISVAKF